MQASNDSDGPGDTFIARLSEAERRRLADDLFSGDPDGVPEDFHEGQTEPTMLESAFGTVNAAVTAVNAVNADIARGVTETPRAVISGAIDAGNAVFGLAGDTMEGIAGLVGVENPQFDVTIPNLDKPESVTGNVVKGVSQFLLPFGALGKASKGLGILQGGGFGTQVARASAQGAIADFAAFKGSEASLGEMLNEIPALKGPVTEFMASGPEDSEVEARLKNALEGVGLGLAFEGVLKGLRATRELIKSRRKVTEPGAEPEVPEQNFEMLGDINDDALVKIQRAGDPERTFADDLADIDDLRRSKIDRAQADQAQAKADRARTTGKIADAIEETDTGVPDEVTARAIAKPPGTAGDDAAEVTVGDLKQLNDSKPVRAKAGAGEATTATTEGAPSGSFAQQISAVVSELGDTSMRGGGSFGQKVAISEAYDAAVKKGVFSGTLDEFKQQLSVAFRKGELDPARADRAELLEPATRTRSNMPLGSDDVDFIVKKPGQPQGAPKKPKALVYELDGFYDKKRALVAMATDGMNAANAVRHEAIHALRESGVITPEQWETLRATARNLKWKTKFQVEDRYEKIYKERFGNVEGEERMLEEAVADAFAAFRRGETFDEPTNKVLGYMSRLVERTAAALRGRGFQNTEDIFKKIEEGELVGQRGRGRAREAFESGDVIVKRPGPLTQDAAQAVADALRILPDGTKLQIEDKIRRRVEQSPVAEKDKMFINMARIDTEADVRRTAQEMADAFKESIDKGSGGVQTFAETKLAASQLDAWKGLLDRRDGEFPGAPMQLAMRELWVRSAELVRLTSNLAENTPSAENIFAFRKQFATHAMIQKEVLNIRTETARAQSAWRISAGSGGLMRARQLEDAIHAFGGMEVNQALAARVSALFRQPNGAEAVEGAISKGATARTMDAVREFWINGLLSGPKTHLVNMLSNTSVAALRVGERALAAQISKALGTDLGVEVGEASAMVAGGIGGLQDGMIYAYRTLRTGETGQYNTDLAGRGRAVLDEGGVGAGQVQPGVSSVAEGAKVESQRGTALQQRAIGATLFGVREDSSMGKAADLIGAALNAPTRALAAEDELFKTVGYRMELHAQAVRMARREVNAGTIPEADYKSRMADIIQDPPESVQLAAIDSATYQTFTNKTGRVANLIKGLREAIPGAQYILPFVNTPANIMSFAFERTPMAPLVGRFREAYNAGGAQRDLAMAQLGAGIMISGAAFDMAMRGQVTGGGPSKSNTSERQALLRRGWQPYSIRIGDRYYAYNRLDPVGLMMGMAADMFEISTASDFSDGYEMDEVVAMVGASVAGNLINKTYLRTLAEVFNVGSDAQRYASPFLERFAGSFVPAIVNEVNTFDDPVARYSTDVIERMKSRTPILSAELPPRRDLWGREISFSSGLGAAYDMVSPIYSKVRKEEPIDTELASQGFYISMPSRRLGYNGVYFNTRNRADVYSRYIQLQGNDLKHPAFGMGAKDLLNAIVSGKHDLSSAYESLTDGDEGGKERMLRQITTSYRQLARSQILQEFPDVAAEVQQELEERRRALQGIQQ